MDKNEQKRPLKGHTDLSSQVGNETARENCTFYGHQVVLKAEKF
jgi:hypothetical protein